MSHHPPPLRWALLLLVAGCSSGTQPGAGPRSNSLPRLTLLSGNLQTGMTGRELGAPLRVRVTRDGRPLSQVAVRWTTDGGTLSGGVSDADGIASATWTLPLQAGGLRAWARLAEPDTGGDWVSFGATAKFPTLTIMEGQGQTDTVGQELPLALKVRLSWEGAPVSGVRLRWGPAVLAADTVSGADGVATARWKLGTVAAPQTTSVALVASGGPSVRFGATALAGPVARVTWDSSVVSLRRFAVAGRADTIRVLLTDGFGNPVAGIRVQWAVVDGAAAIAALDPVSDWPGLARAVVTPAAGNRTDLTLQAQAGGAPPARTLRPRVDFLLQQILLDWDRWIVEWRASPDSIEVRAGTVVRWGIEGGDLLILSLRGQPELVGAFAGDPLTYEYRFDAPGTYEWTSYDAFLGPGPAFTVVVTP